MSKRKAAAIALIVLAIYTAPMTFVCVRYFSRAIEDGNVGRAVSQIVGPVIGLIIVLGFVVWGVRGWRRERKQRGE